MTDGWVDFTTESGKLLFRFDAKHDIIEVQRRGVLYQVPLSDAREELLLGREPLPHEALLGLRIVFAYKNEPDFLVLQGADGTVLTILAKPGQSSMGELVLETSQPD